MLIIIGKNIILISRLVTDVNGDDDDDDNGDDDDDDNGDDDDDDNVSYCKYSHCNW